MALLMFSSPLTFHGVRKTVQGGRGQSLLTDHGHCSQAQSGLFWKLLESPQVTLRPK